MPPRVPSTYEISRVADWLSEVKLRQEKERRESELYDQAFAVVYRALAEPSTSTEGLTTVTPGENDMIEVKRRSPWRFQAPIAHDEELYAIGFRCVQEQRCLLDDPLQPNHPNANPREWRRQPVVLEMSVKHMETQIYEIYPVARFTPHGLSNQLCSVEWAINDEDQTTWSDLEVTPLPGEGEYEAGFGGGASHPHNAQRIETIRDTLEQLLAG